MFAPERAVTLPEVLLAGTLGLLITGLTLQVMSAFFRGTATLTVSNQLQEQAAVALGRMGADSRRSASAGVRLGAERVGLCGLEEVDSRGRQIWDRACTVYYRRGSELLRRVEDQPDWLAFRPNVLSPEQLNQIVLAGKGNSLCTGVQAFQLSLAGADQKGSPLTVRLQIVQRLADRSITFEIHRDFCLRNGE